MIINGNNIHSARVKGRPGDQVLNTTQSVPTNHHCFSGLPLEWGGAESCVYLFICVCIMWMCVIMHMPQYACGG